jgi:hypothetical protein
MTCWCSVALTGGYEVGPPHTQFLLKMIPEKVKAKNVLYLILAKGPKRNGKNSEKLRSSV